MDTDIDVLEQAVQELGADDDTNEKDIEALSKGVAELGGMANDTAKDVAALEEAVQELGKAVADDEEQEEVIEKAIVDLGEVANEVDINATAIAELAQCVSDIETGSADKTSKWELYHMYKLLKNTINRAMITQSVLTIVLLIALVIIAIAK